MNPLKSIKYQLYLFQLENYHIGRYLNLSLKTIGRAKLPPRKELVWTLKAKILFVFALVLQLITAAIITRNLVLTIVFFIILSSVHFVFLSLAVILFWPIDFIVKQIIVGKAKKKISIRRGGRDLKVIGITGSYGKTTMKEAIASVLSQKFKVLKTPENINTPLGISRLILKSLTLEIEIFIVEMGAYKRGDIQALCEITRPKISVLTGINETHLERFGSIENTIMAKFEIVENAQSNALVVLNGDDDRVKQNYQKYLGARKVFFYRRQDDLGDLRKINIPILGEYILGVASACVIIAKELGMSEEQIRQGLMQIKPVPHRLEAILNPAGILVIDDSYNANPDGAREAIKVLAKFNDRRKIYVTPGLVETGERSREIHREIGKELGKVTDMAVLIKNSVTPFIAEGLAAVNFPPENIYWFESAQEAHTQVPQMLRTGDVILFQNDWPDNYI